jgi:AGZA family xanthine/uracil permease-like MFS transporter
VVALGVTWNVALGAVFIAGVIFFLISVSGLRRMLIEAIPPFLAASWAVAIGLFLMFIGLANAGVSVPGIPGAPATLGNFAKPEVIIAFTGIARNPPPLCEAGSRKHSHRHNRNYGPRLRCWNDGLR